MNLIVRNFRGGTFLQSLKLVKKYTSRYIIFDRNNLLRLKNQLKVILKLTGAIWWLIKGFKL